MPTVSDLLDYHFVHSFESRHWIDANLLGAVYYCPRTIFAEQISVTVGFSG